MIAGRLRGRRLEVPDRPGIRPTADRVREALFSILGSLVEDACVLDAYAGSGILGLEAWSRGAASVTFAEIDAAAARALERRVREWGLTGCRVVAGDAAGPGLGRFDVILADPPYGGEEERRLLAAASAALAPGGVLAVERESGAEQAVPDSLDRTRSARYGRATLDFYRVRANPGLG